MRLHQHLFGNGEPLRCNAWAKPRRCAYIYINIYIYKNIYIYHYIIYDPFRLTMSYSLETVLEQRRSWVHGGSWWFLVVPGPLVQA